MKRIRNLTEHKHFRKELRNEGTASEAVLWNELKGKKLCGRKFRRQDGFGPFVVDFYCPDEKLVIEIDGGIHDEPGSDEHDRLRDEWLERRGLRVLRFDNKAILDDLEGVLDEIERHFTPAGQASVEARKSRPRSKTRAHKPSHTTPNPSYSSRGLGTGGET